jgi:hypothetical protein
MMFIVHAISVYSYWLGYKNSKTNTHLNVRYTWGYVDKFLPYQSSFVLVQYPNNVVMLVSCCILPQCLSILKFNLSIMSEDVQIIFCFSILNS